MRIGINAWFIDRPTTGSGQYLTHLLTEFAAQHSKHHYLLCGHTHHARPEILEHLPPQFEWHVMRTPFDRVHRHLAKLWFEQVGVPHVCRRWRADLIHVPYWASPFSLPAPTVVTVHDLIPALLPAYAGGTLGRWYTRMVTLTARRATRVLTDSNAARQDILRHLHIAPDRVQTIYLAADERYRPVRDPDELARARKKYDLPPRYLLYLGGFDVRKNISGILGAYARADVSGVELAIAGKLPDRDTDFSPDPRRTVRELGIADRVRFTGWVDEEDKPALYSGAIAFVFPSYHEGFGLGPIEAMSCGTPVVVSDRGSLPEVVGDGGIAIDPDDLGALARAMHKMVIDGSLREKLGRAGLRRAGQFAWRQTAEETMDAYRRAISDVSGPAGVTLGV